MCVYLANKISDVSLPFGESDSPGFNNAVTTHCRWKEALTSNYVMPRTLVCCWCGRTMKLSTAVALASLQRPVVQVVFVVQYTITLETAWHSVLGLRDPYSAVHRQVLTRRLAIRRHSGCKRARYTGRTGYLDSAPVV
ncbi:hypothetical protein CIB48_g7155 [Xylaria polymorpha]|nr:hypothetical protein CIB48_g7155 [Xylaria polymorpha]